jgi:hypothetical protein
LVERIQVGPLFYSSYGQRWGPPNKTWNVSVPSGSKVIGGGIHMSPNDLAYYCNIVDSFPRLEKNSWTISITAARDHPTSVRVYSISVKEQ